MELSWAGFTQALVASVVYGVLGIILFGLSFLLINALVPFSIRKEIEDDHNVALAIVIAAVILGLSFIIAAAVGT